ncbi:MAG: ribonucleoside-diphosphate reductase, adenosylcobalamin-dependent, ribonucleoside-diphosphate reductase alpha chain [Berkelbacteria bacterium GW2011_GWE1_39_12]|uniref:Vitamin B12-dependent ribonucleotide reductase n=1 Tax=Berkelbacteria bacterium GW2011_GWE1_39_12 TaxID=1618337 RepID=A0A0G4B329_9BACT|nr:MAG: ribonucleoside-diphosphate reductase, adenosylcobalamin-dependent, ribonucleoside-diphosphate reductase alpha chain [Berkelbacteria bacterium GW2011_GWE1_39_12]
MSEMSDEALKLKQTEIAVGPDLKNLKPDLSENALKVIEKRYLIKDRDRKPIETPEDMFRRVAHHIAQGDAVYNASAEEIQKTEDKFYEVLAKLEFLPNSPTFTGAGTKLGQLAACFVLPIEDDMKAILKTQMDMGLIHKSGGGTGFSFSRLRPKDDTVGSTGGVSSGPIGFMQMFNDTTECIKQGGTRRGANMGILRVDHPDILDFISYKEKDGTLSNFNISVALTKEFMDALKEERDYDLINPRTKKIAGKLNAKDVFDKIVNGAWRNGEPGVIFLDKINEKNPTPNVAEIEATNPCGEQPLLPYESCNLGAVNLKKFLKKNKDGEMEFDWDRLDEIMPIVVHFMDNVIDVNKFPILEIEKMTKQNRKIGITVMGFADMLYDLGIAYDSDEGLAMAEKVMSFIERRSHEESSKLVKTRGEFANFKGSAWDKKGAPKMHNAATTSCNPTGTLSIMGSCSSGIEPFFALAYTKTVMDNDALPEVNEHFLRVAKERGFYSEDLMKDILKTGSIQNVDGIPEDIKKVFKVSSDIHPDWHVKMQAAFQRHTDGAISKTINFPNSATEDEVRKAYLLAYDSNCKGLTVYRDGSRAYQVLTTGKKESKTSEDSDTQIAQHTIVASGITIVPRDRPDVTHGYTYRIKTAYGKLYITINDDENNMPFEIFSHLGKAGGFFAAKAEAICRLMSLSLRSGVDPEELIEQLKGIRGPTPTWGEDGKMILSLPDAIAQTLEKHISREQGRLDLAFENEKQAVVDKKEEEIQTQFSNGYSQPEYDKAKSKSLADMGEAPACPDCGAMLELGEGCLKCQSCGYSKCA